METRPAMRMVYEAAKSRARRRAGAERTFIPPPPLPERLLVSATGSLQPIPAREDGAAGPFRAPPGLERGLTRLSRSVTRALGASGLELTFGGEPTFCPFAPGDRPEWRTEALGGDKQALAEWLALRLAHDLGNGAVVSHHEGKDYGDEGGPRFLVRLTWRADGRPLWRDYRRLHAAHAATAAPPSPAEVASVLQQAVGRIADGTLDVAREAGPDGALVVRLPRVEEPERYAAIVTAISAAAEAFDLPPLRLAGAEPPLAPGGPLESFTIVPDVAVIEVNLPPSRSLADATRMARILYAAARRTGLRGYRYHYDGEVAETGGGAQIVVGGPIPARSPFVVRPRLVLGILRYLANHPSLSYAFACAFVGPTSQAPRPDEGGVGRHEELRAALDGLEALADEELTADLVQATLGHVLRDGTGNTHRSELNLEKYWNPFLPDVGRLGLLELRAIAAQPAPLAYAALTGLVGAIVGRLAVRPYREPLVDWGRRLRDRFTLPHFLEADLDAVVLDLGLAGFPVEREWYAPHVDLRFPRAGAIACDVPDDVEDRRTAARPAKIAIEVRRALEPWPVLGDLGLENSKTRAADCSTRRVQVSLPEGAAARRLALFANGCPVSLRPGAPASPVPVLVAGIRYRRFDAPCGLLPFVRAHEPLELEVYDRTTGRFLGGARIHDWKPGGGAYPGFPPDLRKAHARAQERFVRSTAPTLPPAAVRARIAAADARTQAAAAAGAAGLAPAEAERPWVVDLLERLPRGGRAGPITR